MNLSNWMEKLHGNAQTLRSHFAMALALLAIASSVGCDLHADSPEQKQKTQKLMKSLEETSKRIQGAGGRITGMPSYRELCSRASPRIEHARCIHLVVESKTLEQASENARALREEIGSIARSKVVPGLDGSLVLVTPIRRKGDYVGEPTPYALPKYFEQGETIILKVGE